MTSWLEAVRKRVFSDPFIEEFCFYIDKFKMPLWPWERLVKAMVYDLKHQGFKTLLMFIRYAEGAAVAPASVFIHLCGVQKKQNTFIEPKYDIRLAARPLAVFSYLVHIIRDFQKDQISDLQYFADNLLQQNSLTINDLKQVAMTGQVSPAFRKLMTTYVHIAEYYRKKARSVINQTMPMLQPRYRLSLEMIYQLYLQIFERIDPEKGTFTKTELQPEPHMVNQRIQAVLDSFNPEN